MSDEDRFLLIRIKQGDNIAFNQLVNKYKVRAYNVAYAYLHNTHDAQEITQDAFVRVYRSIAKFDERSSFYTWFYRILINLCTDFRRKKRMSYFLFSQFKLKDSNESDAGIEQNIPDPADNNPAKLVLNKELNSKISKALDSLPEKQKTAFVLRHHACLPLKEIAEYIGTAEGTVKSHLARAAKTLELRLGDYMSEVSL